MTDEQIRRFWASARPDGDCLIWAKSCRINGYGQVTLGRRNRSVHRVAYELAYGPIPAGLLVDHTCRTHACINPEHLRLATVKQNAENRALATKSASGVRGVHWDKTRHCWAAALTHNYRTINLGRYANLADAALAAERGRAAYFTHARESA